MPMLVKVPEKPEPMVPGISLSGDARDEREEERDRHNREERMNLELRNRYDHCDDCYYKHNNKRYACHHK